MKTIIKQMGRASIALCVALPLCVITQGCSDKTNDMSDSNRSATNSMSSSMGSMSNNVDANARAAAANADNSAKNIRDRDGSTLTSGDQGTTPADQAMTQQVRKMLVSGKNNNGTNYSMTAQNIKIITMNGKVTLRGPVKSDAEKMSIETIAKNIAGEGNVDNQLEVKMNQDSSTNSTTSTNNN